jgi:hypothetical protein
VEVFSISFLIVSRRFDELAKESASPSSSHHQFELNDSSIRFVDWEMLPRRVCRTDCDYL